MNALEKLKEIKKLVNSNEMFNYTAMVNYYCVGIKEELNYASKCHNLEEELGCPLEVFVKALKNGIYYDDKFETPVFILDNDNFKTKDYHLLVTGTIVYLKDYKETWWLKKDKSE